MKKLKEKRAACSRIDVLSKKKYSRIDVRIRMDSGREVTKLNWQVT